MKTPRSFGGSSPSAMPQKENRSSGIVATFPYIEQQSLYNQFQGLPVPILLARLGLEDLPASSPALSALVRWHGAGAAVQPRGDAGMSPRRGSRARVSCPHIVKQAARSRGKFDSLGPPV
jgi:hypothetical protein